MNDTETLAPLPVSVTSAPAEPLPSDAALAAAEVIRSQGWKPWAKDKSHFEIEDYGCFTTRKMDGPVTIAGAISVASDRMDVQLELITELRVVTEAWNLEDWQDRAGKTAVVDALTQAAYNLQGRGR